MSTVAQNEAEATSDSLAALAGYHYDLDQFPLSDVARCGYAVRNMASGAHCMEDVAKRVVNHFFSACRDPKTGEPDFALVRFFKTHDFGELEESLQRDARAMAPDAQFTNRTKCLVLLATVGLEPQWNDRRQSTGHRAIPLLSEQAVSQIPMITQMIRQFGLELSSVVHPAPELLCDLDQRKYNVFHVEHASGSPFIPAQDNFVKPHGIRSVLGFGGMLPTGNLYTVIAFSRAHISRSTAEAFRTVALKLKATILPFEGPCIFGDRHETPANVHTGDHENRVPVFQSKVAVLEELEGVYDRMVIEQSVSLENLVREVAAANVTLQDEVEQRKQAEAARERLHQQLVDASRKAGMAEVAVSVLHNVGNVLNSVNVSVNLLSERLKKSRHADLKAALDLIGEHASDLDGFLTNDDRGKRILPFLAKLAEVWKADSDWMDHETTSLVANVEHINAIVAMQQSLATTRGFTEVVNVADVVEDALKMENESFSRHHIGVVREFETVPSLILDKQKLLQILVNLIKNAKEAIFQAAQGGHRLTARISQKNRRIVIELGDTGVGISPENLSKIFVHGFTTKQAGHGFGLHHSALCAMELGGQLTVTSDGVGQGATFRLELPIPDPSKESSPK